MPILFISPFTSSLAITLLVLPYSVVLNSNTLISSPSSHLRSVSLPTYRNSPAMTWARYRTPLVSASHGVPLGARLLASGCSWYSIKRRANCRVPQVRAPVFWALTWVRYPSKENGCRVFFMPRGLRRFQQSGQSECSNRASCSSCPVARAVVARYPHCR